MGGVNQWSTTPPINHRALGGDDDDDDDDDDEDDDDDDDDEPVQPPNPPTHAYNGVVVVWIGRSDLHLKHEVWSGVNVEEAWGWCAGMEG